MISKGNIAIMLIKNSHYPNMTAGYQNYIYVILYYGFVPVSVLSEYTDIFSNQF